MVTKNIYQGYEISDRKKLSINTRLRQQSQWWRLGAMIRIFIVQLANSLTYMYNANSQMSV